MSSPPPNSGCHGAVSANEGAPHPSCLDGGASALLPGESLDSPLKDLSTQEFGTIHDETHASMNSPIGSVDSHEYFNDEVHELHDFLEKDELKMMQELFKTMDLDDIGKIRWDQARVLMAKMGRKLTDDQFAKLVDRYDLDKNGDLEFSEFCSMYLDHMKRRVKNNDTLLEVFAFLDRNEHGRVSREDVESCLNIANIQLSEEDLDIMLQSIGLDDDGTFRLFETGMRASANHKDFNFVGSRVAISPC